MSEAIPFSLLMVSLSKTEVEGEAETEAETEIETKTETEMGRVPERVPFVQRP